SFLIIRRPARSTTNETRPEHETKTGRGPPPDRHTRGRFRPRAHDNGAVEAVNKSAALSPATPAPVPPRASPRDAKRTSGASAEATLVPRGAAAHPSGLFNILWFANSSAHT